MIFSTDYQIQDQYWAGKWLAYSYAAFSHCQTPGSRISRLWYCYSWCYPIHWIVPNCCWTQRSSIVRWNHSKYLISKIDWYQERVCCSYFYYCCSSCLHVYWVSRTNDDTTNNETDTPEPLLYAVLEHKPFNNIADNAITLKSRRLEIIFNPAIVRGVLDFFKPPENKSESINALLEAAGESLEGFKQQTLTGLEYALNQHTTLAVDMDMDAPIIIIPER